MELWYTENQTDNVKFSMRVKKTLYSKKSQFQQIDVIDTYDFGRVLVIDGWTMITEKDEFIYHEMITHVPIMVNKDIKNVLVIGAGDGGTVRELTRFNSIERIDMVELDEEVVKAAREYLPFTSCKLDDPRVNLYFQDGIKFVENKKNLYDLIIVDSTDPIGPGEGLFTREFYKNCYESLTDKGILVNQGESPYYDMKNVLVIGAGDGGTVRELTRFNSIQRIDMVELDEEVVKAAREYLPFTSCKLDDPRVNLYFQDGIKFVENKKNLYDLIIVDSTDPIGPGEGLFTRDFYKNCYEALTDKGILVNQGESPYYDMNKKEMKRSNEKLKDIFPICEVYQYMIPTYPSGYWFFGFASKKLHPVNDFDEVKRSNEKLKDIFPICEVYQYMIPTYPSGYWFFGFASKKLHPVNDFDEEFYNSLNLKDRYYNKDVHKASFALPNYVKELLK